MRVQVTNVRLNDKNIAEIRLVELPVSKVKLMFRDRETGKFTDKSHTDPRVIHRYITTSSGQVQPQPGFSKN